MKKSRLNDVLMTSEKNRVQHNFRQYQDTEPEATLLELFLTNLIEQQITELLNPVVQNTSHPDSCMTSSDVQRIQTAKPNNMQRVIRNITPKASRIAKLQAWEVPAAGEAKLSSVSHTNAPAGYYNLDVCWDSLNRNDWKHSRHTERWFG